MELSLISACPIARPDLFKSNKPQQFQGFGLTINYDFEAAYKNKIVFKVNQKEFYQKVMKAGSSGFLFWKKNWQTMDIDKIDSTSYSFNWELTDPYNKYDRSTRRRMEADAVNFIITDLLSKYGEPYRGQDVVLPAKPTSGLSEVGDSLVSLCGVQNVYCATAGWVMKSLDAIIGSGNSTASGRRNFESTETITWDETILENVGGVTTYTTKKEDLYI